MIIDYPTLQQLFGGSSAAEVAVRLQQAGVKFLNGKRGQPFTTETAINAAMGLKSPPIEPTEQPVNSEIQVL